MSDFNPQKLSVKLMAPATSSQPIEGRKYTLTHSDITAELFLDIGYVYNYEAVNGKYGMKCWRNGKMISMVV